MVYGVNHDKLTKEHLVISNASCTTNCLAPVAKVLNDAVGIEHGFMTTIHSYTGDQPTLDTMHKDLYRARAAALSMIPTTTGAAKAVGLVLPELKGKLDGSAIRVPTPNVSVVDLKFVAKRATTHRGDQRRDQKAAAAGPLKGMLGYTDQPNVSIDFNHDPHSSIFHLDQTKVIDGNFVRILSLVRQRVGLLEPHGRHGRRDGQAHLRRLTSDGRRLTACTKEFSGSARRFAAALPGPAMSALRDDHARLRPPPDGEPWRRAASAALNRAVRPICHSRAISREARAPSPRADFE